MSMQVMQKLRALAIQAQAKIWLNRHKQQGKWPVESFDAQGHRTWTSTPVEWLVDKLQEEVYELKDETLAVTPILPDLRREAGDVTAMAMMIVDRLGGFNHVKTPKVVCLCGSTKFKDAFLQAQGEETLKGHIVLSVGLFMHADNVQYTFEQKEMLDQLHKRKIDLADEILVLNVSGYIGDSTRSEIRYAFDTGKEIRYLEPIDPYSLLTSSSWPFPSN